jgi:ADP-heptose:LPS heptosyltransferase
VERKSLAKLATIFVGTDTAELHVAAAVGTKCVGLFGAESALENAPFGWEHRMIQSPHQQSQRQRKHTALSEWMEAITPELVCEKCDEMLSEMLQPNVLPMQQVPFIQRRAA